jgi:hypothetical protein
MLFRLLQDNGAYSLREVPQASCPVCGAMLQLPEDVQAGASANHCDQTFIVTYAYGAYALEHTQSKKGETMRRLTARQAFFISVLLLMTWVSIGYSNTDSRDSDIPKHAETMDTQAGAEQLQRSTLRITGMS